jgi:hypothetical protein
MTIAAIRQRLITIIADADDKKVKAIYTLLADDQKGDHNYVVPDEEWALIEEDRVQYMKGEGKSYTWEEVKKTITDTPEKKA